LQSYPFYIDVDPEGDFDIEYLGGQRHEELIDGVQFFFPASDGDKLGVVEVWGNGCVMSAAVRGRPEADSAAFVPGWSANVDRVLEALDLPIRILLTSSSVSRLFDRRLWRQCGSRPKLPYAVHSTTIC
jgi:hypothetical protein